MGAGKDMRHLLLGAGLLVLTLLTVSGCALLGDGQTPFDNHVTLRSGTVAGTPPDGAGIRSFKGIAYAAPPVGELRWKPPQLTQSWSGVRSTAEYGARCWASQPMGGPIVTQGVSEDCLFLNVWTGARTRGDKLPVMVFLHGGGFQFGSGAEPVLDGAALARRGVLLVTFNYRLGVFGFMAIPELDAEAGVSSGMYGLRDQIAALQWVKENIAGFGGDPGNVTVFGESAGAHAVGMLMASPQAAGLFHKAIGQSGAFWESESGEMKPLAAAHATGADLAVKLGADSLGKLRSVPADQLQAASNWTFASDPSTVFAPVIDGQVLPDAPARQFARGQQHKVPLLAGWNADEGSLFVPRALPHQTPEAFSSAAAQRFGSANLSRFLALYPAASAPEAAQSARLLVGDQVISQQTWKWAGLHRRTGSSPVYVYHFEQSTPYNPVAAHVSDVGYVFGNLLSRRGVAAGPKDVELSETMQRYWTQFARSGNPNDGALPRWPQYGGAGSQVMHLGATVQASKEPGTDRFEFLERLSANPSR